MHFLAAAFALLLLTHCSKDRTVLNAHFCSGKDTAEVKLSLFIDGTYKGELPYLAGMPGCNSEGMLSLSLEPGAHELTAKDSQGKVRSSGTVKIKRTSQRSSMSSSGSMGGQDISLQGDCLLVKFYY